jgi:AraC-like DNA-binding protein
MKKDPHLYRCDGVPDPDFPIHIFERFFTSKGTMFREHWHEQLQFFFFTSGKAVIRLNGEIVSVSKGNFIAVNPFDLHSGENISGKLSFVTVCINPEFLASSSIDRCQSEYIAPLSDNRIILKHGTINDLTIINAMKLIITEYFSAQPGYELLIKGLIFQVLSLLVRNHSIIKLNKSMVGRRKRTFEQFKIISDYLKTHINDHVTLDDMAEKVHLSRFHFSRMFKSITGVSPLEYLNRLRIDKAASLLRASDTDITGIAMVSGFDDPNYFCRQFRRIKGCTPSAYRQKAADVEKECSPKSGSCRQCV